MLFSVIPKNVGFAAESAVAIAESIAGTEYDLESDLQKIEIRERVRLGPSTGSIVEEAFQKYSLDPIRN
jgi:cyanophycin synthetase